MERDEQFLRMFRVTYSLLGQFSQTLEAKEWTEFYAGDLTGYDHVPNEVINRVKQERRLRHYWNYDDDEGFERNDCGHAYRTQKQKRLGRRSLDWTKAHVIIANKELLRNLLHEGCQLWSIQGLARSE